jgi:hypothetical protein
MSVMLAAAATAQQPKGVTAADYARANKFLAPNLTGLVVGGAVTPVWLPDNRFWYRNTTLNGAEVAVVDAVKRHIERCNAKSRNARA